MSLLSFDYPSQNFQSSFGPPTNWDQLSSGSTQVSPQVPSTTFTEAPLQNPANIFPTNQYPQNQLNVMPSQTIQPGQQIMNDFFANPALSMYDTSKMDAKGGKGGLNPGGLNLQGSQGSTTTINGNKFYWGDNGWSTQAPQAPASPASNVTDYLAGINPYQSWQHQIVDPSGEGKNLGMTQGNPTNAFPSQPAAQKIADLLGAKLISTPPRVAGGPTHYGLDFGSGEVLDPGSFMAALQRGDPLEQIKAMAAATLAQNAGRGRDANAELWPINPMNQGDPLSRLTQEIRNAGIPQSGVNQWLYGGLSPQQFAQQQAARFSPQSSGGQMQSGSSNQLSQGNQSPQFNPFDLTSFLGFLGGNQLGGNQQQPPNAGYNIVKSPSGFTRWQAPYSVPMMGESDWMNQAALYQLLRQYGLM